MIEFSNPKILHDLAHLFKSGIYEVEIQDTPSCEAEVVHVHVHAGIPGEQLENCDIVEHSESIEIN